MNDVRLQVASIFTSIQGEGRSQGLRCSFVRLSGCNLNCTYCDTPQARTIGTSMSVDDIMRALAGDDCRFVTVTGGEPLLQPGCVDLLRVLVRHGRTPSLETNGSLPIDGVPRGVSVVLDLKTPGSAMHHNNVLDNVALLRPGDELKFVITDATDYRWSCDLLRTHPPPAEANVLFGPAWGVLEPRRLAEWIVADRLPVRLNLQLHKFIWEDDGEEH